MATKKTQIAEESENYNPKPFAEAFAELTEAPQTEEKQANLPVVKPKKTGRPSKYTKEIAESICEQLSEGIPLREICRQDGMPAWRTVYDWMRQDEALSTAIAHARDLGYDNLAEQCLHIADNQMFGEEVTESEDDKGVKHISVKRIDMLGHRKLQIETRLKLLAKFNPKKYGDSLTHKGDAENPVEMGVTMLDAFVKKLELKAQAKNAE
jgi:hypothetical protein